MKDFVEKEIRARIGIDVNSDPVDTSKLPGQPNMNEAPEGNAMAQVLQGAQNPATTGDQTAVVDDQVAAAAPTDESTDNQVTAAMPPEETGRSAS